MTRLRLSILLTLCALLLAGCNTVSYYGQSVIGHSKLMLSRVSVDKAIIAADQAGDLELSAQLQSSQLMRTFAIEQLALPDNNSYRSFAQPPDEYPVYTVVAAPEFSLEAQQWCYPIIGCASYRGYFKQQAAHDYARSLQQQGYETSVGGASAYSTLGWFSDPLLPSMMRFGEANLAEILFHELAHQRLYINGDSAFNEAFASLVGEEGAKRWLAAHNPEGVRAYVDQLSAQRTFYALLDQAKLSLQELYASHGEVSELRSAKVQIFKQLELDYQLLRHTEWNGRDWFERWFAEPLNNARLAAYSTYHEKLPSLEHLLRNCGDDLEKFYARLASLKTKDRQVSIPEECHD